MQKRHLRVVNELGRVTRDSKASKYTPNSLDEDFDFEIPFEDEKNRPVALHERSDTSVTATEREAFKKLFEEYAARAKEATEEAEKDFEFSNKGALDEILADALGPMSTREGPGPGMTKPIRKMDGTAIKKRKKEAGVSGRYALLRREQAQQYDRVVEMFNAAQSDIELWNVLDNEVFTIIRKLNLDESGTLESAMDTTSDSEDAEFSELEIIGPNYPTFLLHAMRQLRIDFPNSTLAMSVLPMVKSFGRESFALGVSTELYNELIAISWLTYADLQGIDEILTEMHDGGIRFDQATYDMIRSIVYTARKVPGFQPGTSFRYEISRLDRFDQGKEKLFRWSQKMREKFDFEAIQALRSQKIETRY